MVCISVYKMNKKTKENFALLLVLLTLWYTTAWKNVCFTKKVEMIRTNKMNC